ncbi:MAG: MBOAT family O-acyltransferase [Eubacteriales bacterium]|nr:MBOAT family O-acyltransferase [Eubacteriales bacterium]
MVFNSAEFLIFFPIVLFIYFIIPKKTRYIWLLAASYYFYMCWNPKYAVLMALSTVITYASGLAIEFCSRRKLKVSWKKAVVAVSFCLNLGILAVFKYSGFLIDNLNIVLSRMHINTVSHLNILLPVGISFYTFQALGYTVDVYRGSIRAEKNVLRYALFVSFFPQLVAGPIERSGNLLTQIQNVDKMKLWNLEQVSSGLMIMLWGFFQKMVIADRISIVVDQVYGNYWLYGTVELVLATIFFAIQMYCDFSSYSLIAIGAARTMGFSLMQNFNAPFFARSIKEFWNRWHISLSLWFRDYLYFPMGGSRCSRLKKYRNIMVTFLVSGLWHGANWTYVIGGGLHGVYQVAGDLLMPVRKRFVKLLKVNTECMSFRLGQILIAFSLNCITMIFFRSRSLSDAVTYIRRLVTRPNIWTLYDKSLYNLGLDQGQMHILAVSLLVLLFADLLQYRKGLQLEQFLRMQNLWFRWGVAIAMLYAVITYGVYGPAYDPTQFIYFQF